MKPLFFLTTVTCCAILAGCSTAKPSSDTPKVLAVASTGQSTSYTFAVTLATPDTGCSRYADWWEVTSPDGQRLYYRRVLAHSHVDEQPFTRSGGPVAIESNTEVVVRVHMNDSGYSTLGMKGSVAKGFEETTLDEGFGQSLLQAEPKPQGCDF